MISLRRSSLLVGLGLVVGSLAACTTWEASAVAPEQLLAGANAPYRVLVRDRTGHVVTLVNPKVVQDSVVGGEESRSTPGTPYVRRAVALADVETVAVNHRDGLKTAAVVGAPAAAFFLGGFFVGY
jgi:hypothetical protein